MIAELSWPLLVRIHIGPLALSPHGIGIAVGFLAGARLMMPAAEAAGIPREDTQRMLGRALVGAIVGARLFYVLNHASELGSPLEALAVWKGGISLLGGIAGAILAAAPLWRARGFRFGQVMDAAAPGLALGVLIGRLGDLVIGDHLGKTTTFVLGFRCPDPAVVGQTVGSPCPAGQIVHQAALYDFLLTIPLLALLLLLRRRTRPEGSLFSVWLVAYGFNRLLEDFTRIDKHILGLTGSQWTAIGMMISGAVWLTRLRSGRPHPLAPADGSPRDENATMTSLRQDPE